MIGAQTTVDDTGGYARSTTSAYHYGKKATCELCQETRQCLDCFGLVVCDACQHDYLPARGLLSIR